MAAIVLEECTVDHVVKALNQRQNAGPASLKQIKAALPKPLRQCDDALAEALRQGRVWKYAVVRKADQYWTEDPVVFASGLAEKKIRQSPGGLTEKELIKSIDVAFLKGIIDPREVIRLLISQGLLFVQPKIKKAGGVKYTVEPYDFVDQLVNSLIDNVTRVTGEHHLELTKAMERVRRLLTPQDSLLNSNSDGSVPEAVPESIACPLVQEPESSISDAEISALILQAMREVNPRSDDGDLVLIRELRQRLDFHQIEKSRFDRTLLDLFAARKVILSKTSAGLVSDADKQIFVADSDGNFYNTVAYWKAS